MAIQPILRMGHPTLREPARAVDPTEISQLGPLLTDLRDTLADSGGIGLAAPQIGVGLRVAIIDLPGGPSRYGELPTIPCTAFINPVVEVLNPATAGYWEGCLSVPGLRGFVERPQSLRVTALDGAGEPTQMQFDGFAATVIQHEFDHLDGTLYIDRITDSKLLMFEAEFETYVLAQE
ncbi:MAG: peptide deformylase [Pseudomonadales bacterium]